MGCGRAVFCCSASGRQSSGWQEAKFYRFFGCPDAAIRNLPWSSTAAAIFTEPRQEGAHPSVLAGVESSQTGSHTERWTERVCFTGSADGNQPGSSPSFWPGRIALWEHGFRRDGAVQGSRWGFRLRHDSRSAVVKREAAVDPQHHARTSPRSFPRKRHSVRDCCS